MNWNGRYRKGYMKTVRQLKREEAEARNAKYRAAQETEAGNTDDRDD